MTSLLKRIDLGPEAGFKDFHKEGDSLCNQPIRIMSKLTQKMLMSIDYEDIGRKRRNNFICIHNAIGESNQLNIPLEYDAVPMVYPYLTDKEGMRKMLIDNKVFVAKYWPNVDEWVEIDSLEWKLANHMIAIPIDQRYGEKVMGRIFDLIKANE